MVVVLSSSSSLDVLSFTLSVVFVPPALVISSVLFPWLGILAELVTGDSFLAGAALVTGDGFLPCVALVTGESFLTCAVAPVDSGNHVGDKSTVL